MYVVYDGAVNRGFRTMHDNEMTIYLLDSPKYQSEVHVCMLTMINNSIRDVMFLFFLYFLENDRKFVKKKVWQKKIKEVT